MPVIQQESRRVGWLVTLAITAVAGVLRFWRIGDPWVFAFDETYYAKDAWSLMNHGYVTTYLDGANDQILAGHLYDQYTNTASQVVHPEVGKYLIGLSELIFGMNPIGWRISSAVIGTLMIMLMIRFVRRITGSMLLAGIAGVLMTFDGLQFVLSRLAFLDIYVAFFSLLAVHLLIMDRDWSRRRLAEAIPIGAPPPKWGPLMLYRPYRLLAGATFGLAVGSKWSALFVLAAFGLMVVAWDSGARHAIGVRHWFTKSVLVDAIPAFLYLVGVGLIVYVATWAGLLIHYKEYEQALANSGYTAYWGSYVTTETHGFFPQLIRALRDLWHYHEALYNFHTESLNGVPQTFASNPLSWPVLHRPILVAFQNDIPPGVDGCTAAVGSTCLRQQWILGTPALWWAGIPALLYAGYSWIARRDWRFGVAVVGFLAGWLPWFMYDQRQIYLWYTSVLLPFTILALTLTLGRVLGPRDASEVRRTLGASAVGAMVLLVVVNFIWFWPIFAYQVMTHTELLQRMWFRSWT